MSERPETQEAKSDPQRESEEAQPCQESPAAGSPTSPSFTGPDGKAPLNADGLPDPGAPASHEPPPSVEPVAVTVDPGAQDPETAETAPAETSKEDLQAGDTPELKVVDPDPSFKEMASEISELRSAVDQMKQEAGDRILKHRAQLLSDMGLRKEEYGKLAPDADPATDEGRKILRSFALENPGLFKENPGLPSEKEQGNPQSSLRTARRSWRDVFGA